jgi:GTP-binding protein HflX
LSRSKIVVHNHNPESVFLVGLETRASSRDPSLTPAESLAELSRLAETAGLRVAGSDAQKLITPHPATYVGSGKAEEIREQLRDKAVETVIFDGELAPGQQRNLERLFGESVKVLDRSALILDIFAQHAHTREGQLQVELAQYEYRLPRLTRLWTHLVRQAGGRAGGRAGGVGLRGPGETQLESDRRQIRQRITLLKRELEKVRRHRDAAYRHRRRRGIRTAALVGYTNAGKSSLLNALSKAGEGRAVETADQLFATLDPTTRRIRLPRGSQILVTDTVGFINKLPVDLIAAFRATLEGIARADLLLHVVDVTSVCTEAHIRTVEQVLNNLGAGNIPRLLVWNKIDLLPHFPDSRSKAATEKKRVAVSAKSGENLSLLLKAMEEILKGGLVPIEVLLPYGDDRLKNLIFEQGMVEWFRCGPEGTRIRAHVPPSLASLPSLTSLTGQAEKERPESPGS